MSQADLAKVLGVNPNNFFYVARNLECRGLVVRYTLLARDTQTSRCMVTNVIYLARYAKDMSLQGGQRYEVAKALPVDAEVTSSAQERDGLTVGDDSPAMEAICQKLEQAEGRALVCKDLKSSLGYRLTSGHRSWRRIYGKLENAGVVETFSATVGGKVMPCVRLLRPLRALWEADKSSMVAAPTDKEPDLDMARGQVNELLEYQPLERQIYDVVEAAGPPGIFSNEIWTRLGQEAKRMQIPLKNLISQYGLVSEAELLARATVYRVYTAENWKLKQAEKAASEKQPSQAPPPCNGAMASSKPEHRTGTEGAVEILSVQGTKETDARAVHEQVPGEGSQRMSEGRHGPVPTTETATQSETELPIEPTPKEPTGCFALLLLSQLQGNQASAKSPVTSEERECAGAEELATPLVTSEKCESVEAGILDDRVTARASGNEPERARLKLTTDSVARSYPLSATFSKREHIIMEVLMARRWELVFQLQKKVHLQEGGFGVTKHAVDKKTIRRVLASLQAAGKLKMIIVNAPSLLTNTLRSLEVAVLPSVEVNKELLREIVARPGKLKAAQAKSAQPSPSSLLSLSISNKSLADAVTAMNRARRELVKARDPLPPRPGGKKRGRNGQGSKENFEDSDSEASAEDAYQEVARRGQGESVARHQGQHESGTTTRVVRRKLQKISANTTARPPKPAVPSITMSAGELSHGEAGAWSPGMPLDGMTDVKHEASKDGDAAGAATMVAVAGTALPDGDHGTFPSPSSAPADGLEELEPRDEAGQGKGASNQQASRQRRALRKNWAEADDRNVLAYYAKERARGRRLLWTTQGDLPAAPDACRRRITKMKMDSGTRDALYCLVSLLTRRHAQWVRWRKAKRKLAEAEAARSEGSVLPEHTRNAAEIVAEEGGGTAAGTAAGTAKVAAEGVSCQVPYLASPLADGSFPAASPPGPHPVELGNEVVVVQVGEAAEAAVVSGAATVLAVGGGQEVPSSTPSAADLHGDRGAEKQFSKGDELRGGEMTAGQKDDGGHAGGSIALDTAEEARIAAKAAAAGTVRNGDGLGGRQGLLPEWDARFEWSDMNHPEVAAALDEVINAYRSQTSSSSLYRRPPDGCRPKPLAPKLGPITRPPPRDGGTSRCGDQEIDAAAKRALLRKDREAASTYSSLQRGVPPPRRPLRRQPPEPALEAAEQKVRLSARAATAVELIKAQLFHLQASMAPATNLTAALRQLPEADVVAAFEFLRAKKLVVPGYKDLPYQLCSRFTEEEKPQSMPLGTANFWKEADEWLSKREPESNADWAAVPPVRQIGQIIPFLVMASAGELVLEPLLPESGVGEAPPPDAKELQGRGGGEAKVDSGWGAVVPHAAPRDGMQADETEKHDGNVREKVENRRERGFPRLLVGIKHTPPSPPAPLAAPLGESTLVGESGSEWAASGHSAPRGADILTIATCPEHSGSKGAASADRETLSGSRSEMGEEVQNAAGGGGRGEPEEQGHIPHQAGPSSETAGKAKRARGPTAEEAHGEWLRSVGARERESELQQEFSEQEAATRTQGNGGRPRGPVLKRARMAGYVADGIGGMDPLETLMGEFEQQSATAASTGGASWARYKHVSSSGEAGPNDAKHSRGWGQAAEVSGESRLRACMKQFCSKGTAEGDGVGVSCRVSPLCERCERQLLAALDLSVGAGVEGVARRDIIEGISRQEGHVPGQDDAASSLLETGTEEYIAALLSSGLVVKVNAYDHARYVAVQNAACYFLPLPPSAAGSRAEVPSPEHGGASGADPLPGEGGPSPTNHPGHSAAPDDRNTADRGPEPCGEGPDPGGTGNCGEGQRSGARGDADLGPERGGHGSAAEDVRAVEGGARGDPSPDEARGTGPRGMESREQGFGTPCGVQLRPWSSDEGGVNRAFLGSLLRRLVDLAVLHPGVAEAVLLDALDHVNPQTARELLEFLVSRNVLQVQAVASSTWRGAGIPQLLRPLVTGGNRSSATGQRSDRFYFADPSATKLLQA